MKVILIAGASSSSGKTLISCGLLRAFSKRGLKVCAYKTGPDYIDTEYLRRSGRCEAYNLDTWLMSEDKARELFFKTSNGKDVAIIEGAMGLYDGGENSTAAIAKLLNVPVVLVINAKSLGESAAAVALGFKNFDSEIKLAGVILNCVGSKTHTEIISDALERINIKLLNIKSKFINTDTLLTYKDILSIKSVPIVINEGKFYAERLLSNLYQGCSGAIRPFERIPFSCQRS